MPLAKLSLADDLLVSSYERRKLRKRTRRSFTNTSNFMQKQEDKNAAHKNNTADKAENTSKPVAQDKSGTRTTHGDKKTDRDETSDTSRKNTDAKEHPEMKRTK